MGLPFDPISAVGVGGLAAAEAWYANRTADKRAHEQMDFQSKMFQSRYQMQVQDLKAAGLNPMLAYSQSPGAAPQGAAGPVQKSEVARTINESRIASAQEGNIVQDTLKKQAEQKNIDMDTLVKAGLPAYFASLGAAAMSNSAQAEAMVVQIRAVIPKIEAEIKNIQSQTTKLKSDVQLNESLIEANRVLNGLRVLEGHLVGVKTDGGRLQNAILGPEASAAKDTGYMRHTADNIGSLGSMIWKFLFPTFSSPSSAGAIGFRP